MFVCQFLSNFLPDYDRLHFASEEVQKRHFSLYIGSSSSIAC